MGFSQAFHSYIPVFWAMRLGSFQKLGNHQSTVFLEGKWEGWKMPICLGSPVDEPSGNWNHFVFLLFFSHHLPFISMPLVAICHARRITITSWWPTASSVKAVAKGYRLRRPKLSNSFWICNALQCRQEGKCLGSMEYYALWWVVVMTVVVMILVVRVLMVMMGTKYSSCSPSLLPYLYHPKSSWSYHHIAKDFGSLGSPQLRPSQNTQQSSFSPWKLTYSLKIDGWKMKFPIEMVPFQGTCFFCFFWGGKSNWQLYCLFVRFVWYLFRRMASEIAGIRLHTDVSND